MERQIVGSESSYSLAVHGTCRRKALGAKNCAKEKSVIDDQNPSARYSRIFVPTRCLVKSIEDSKEAFDISLEFDSLPGAF